MLEDSNDFNNATTTSPDRPQFYDTEQPQEEEAINGHHQNVDVLSQKQMPITYTNKNNKQADVICEDIFTDQAMSIADHHNNDIEHTAKAGY